MIKYLRWGPALVLLSSIYYLSSIPGLRILSDKGLMSIIAAKISALLGYHAIKIGTSGFFSYIISTDPEFIAHKIGHIVFYSLLGAAFYYAVQRVGLAWLLSVIAAASDELHQYFVAGRSSRFGDIVLDSLAAIGAIIVMRKLMRKRIDKPRRGAPILSRGDDGYI